MPSPLVHRELLVQGRYWGNYWLRVLMGVSGLTGLGVLWLIEILRQDTPMPSGLLAAIVLGAVHVGITAMLGLGGAVLTADCLARERREGTLGLLFLTPLTARDITLGKCAGQMLRLGSLWLTAIPFLAIPFLMGGVTPRNFLDAILIHVTAGCTGLTAGLLATSKCQQWRWAMILAVVWLVVLYGGLMVVSTVGVFGHLVVDSGAAFTKDWLGFIPLMPLLVFGGLPMEGPAGMMGGGVPLTIVTAARFALLMLMVWSVVFLLVSVAWVLRTLSRVRDNRESVQTSSISTPTLNDSRATVIPTAGAPVRPWDRRERWLMDFNPIHWRERLGTLPRLAPGLLIGIVLLVWAGIGVVCLTDDNNGEWVYLGWALPPLLGLIAVIMAAASYRQEHEEGALELILCTSLEPWKLVTGRLRSVMGIVLPAFVVAILFCAAFRGPGHEFGGNAAGYFRIPAHIYQGPGWGLWALMVLVYLGWMNAGERFMTGRLYLVGWTVVVSLSLGGLLMAVLGPDAFLDRVYLSNNLSTAPVRWKEQSAWICLVGVTLTSGLDASCLALRCAVRRVNPIFGALIGLAVGVMLPYLAGALFLGLFGSALSSPYPWWYEYLTILVALPLQLVIAATALWIAHRDLVTRQFQFRPFQRRPG